MPEQKPVFTDPIFASAYDWLRERRDKAYVERVATNILVEVLEHSGGGKTKYEFRLGENLIQSPHFPQVYERVLTLADERGIGKISKLESGNYLYDPNNLSSAPKPAAPKTSPQAAGYGRKPTPTAPKVVKKPEDKSKKK